MQVNDHKASLGTWEKFFMIILTPFVYLFAARLLSDTIRFHVYEKIPSPLVVLAVLSFDVIWMIVMALLPSKIRKIKVILTWLVLTLSASALTSLWLTHVSDHLW